ncbi:MAG: N-formylglutamate amidohydrolase [Pseudoruegeria sp.]
MTSPLKTLGDIAQAIPPAQVINQLGSGPFMLVCASGSHRIPSEFHNLKLEPSLLDSHICKDLGILGFATHLAKQLNSPLVISTVSPLVYDCTQPADSAQAIITKRGGVPIPGNAAVNKSARRARSDKFHSPFRDLIEETISNAHTPPVLVSLQSFHETCFDNYDGTDIAIIHDRDTSIAEAILISGNCLTPFDFIKINTSQTAGGSDYILTQHGVLNGILNVKLSIRDSLIQSTHDQSKMAETISRVLIAALEIMKKSASKRRQGHVR